MICGLLVLDLSVDWVLSDASRVVQRPDQGCCVKIVYLVSVLDGGGAALPIADVVSVMRDLGHEVEVVALMPKDRRACDRLEKAGLRYRIIGDRSHRHVVPWFRLFRLLRAEKPDLLWTSLIQATVYGQLAGALLKVPVVSWQHNAFLKPTNRQIFRATKQLTCRWVADSTTVANFAAREIGLSADCIDVWPLFYADPGQPRAQPWNGEGVFRFGSLGRLHPNKKYDVLIEAAAIIARRAPEAAARMTFEIAGAGGEQATLEALAKARGVGNVHFVGFRKNAFEFLAGLHGYVQPSRNEGLCIAVHEAMHAGLPVVATPVGELASSIVSGETGYHCAVDDSESLADALLAIFSDPAGAARMGEAARAFVGSRFSREKFIGSGRIALEHAQAACLGRAAANPSVALRRVPEAVAP